MDLGLIDNGKFLNSSICIFVSSLCLRALLQQAFFPPTFTDATPMARLKEGDPRVWPCLKILVELRDGVMLQIPFREPSKVCEYRE